MQDGGSLTGLGGILTGPAIKREVEAGRIVVDPWDPTHLDFEDRINPASYDLTLGDEVAVYASVTHHLPGQKEEEDGTGISANPHGVLSVKSRNEVRRFKIRPETGWLLKPGIGYLMHTVERIRTDHYVPILDGKSSIGRLFAAVHVTAGYGDPGFDGQYTLEVIVTHQARVYPGMRFCQIRFHTTVGEMISYQKTGSYKGDHARGPVPSKSWRMFRGPDGG